MSGSATGTRDRTAGIAAPGEAVAVHRIEVRPLPRAGDPLGRSVMHAAAAVGVRPAAVRTARVYLIEAALAGAARDRLRTGLLSDPVLESSLLGASPVPPGAELVEIHPLPGVMDPAALTVERAARELLALADEAPIRVVTGWRYDIEGVSRREADELARRLLANPVIEAIHREPHHPARLPTHAGQPFELRRVPITTLDDAALESLSRDGHLFLSLDEMRAIRDEYRRLKREPTDIELETLAQTWSEHCVHKTLKSRITYRHRAVEPSVHQTKTHDPIRWEGRPGHTVNPDGSVTIDNLLKSTVAAATHELIVDGVDWTLSVFKDNAGVIAFDERHAVCVKVETHNHPSAIEPYGGAATGVGGCIRDVMGTGLGARPIANTDVFCVATPDIEAVPNGCLHPRRVLTRVVDGVRDYGNRMGIPTINGAVYFDDRYIGNPLVFCGCVGVMPRDKIRGRARPGDLIIALGGRTGRDGIHGATFSSAELTDTHADEFSHAVQIGNAIEEKRTLDAILRARDDPRGCLFNAITDCGAGGFSSAVGEMGAEIGAAVFLERAPLKYDGLRYDEIWISESQERMILAVPPGNLAALRAICREESVELCELGVFGPPLPPASGASMDGPQLVLNYRGTEVGRLSMRFLHDGIPMPTREAVWQRAEHKEQSAVSESSLPTSSVLAASPAVKSSSDLDIRATLLKLLAHPNIASKRWIVRQYDHEVQGNTIVKPLVGPGGVGPGDAAVIRPVPSSPRGLAVGCGLATPLGDPALGGDPYVMALAAVDECVRNLVCVGADPSRIAILDNFCWPSCADPKNLASLVRAAEGCYDAARAYRTPFVSGKDSLNNQFRAEDGRLIEIPPTLLITGIGIVPDVAKCVTMDLKRPGNQLALVGWWGGHLARSHAEAVCGIPFEHDPRLRGDDPDGHNVIETMKQLGPRFAGAIHTLIREGVVHAAHDCAEGGVLTAVAEMVIAAADHSTRLGFTLRPDLFHAVGNSSTPAFRRFFSEDPCRYVIEFSGVPWRELAGRMRSEFGLPMTYLGDVDDSGSLNLVTPSRYGSPELNIRIPADELRAAFLGTLDW